MSAGKHRLSNLTVIVDYNKHQSYATTAEVMNLEPFADKWKAFGFAVEEVDGHDVGALRSVLRRVPFHPEKPSAVICHTVKGKGFSFTESNMHWHHKSKISDEEVLAFLKELETDHA
jgi:transketolase